nr:tetratricopeptide repeat protein [Methylomonas fluvii]
MDDVRKNYDEAERLYRKALELDPNSAKNTGNFAIFIAAIRKDYNEAERLYRKALELDPKNANNAGNFACFKLIQNQLIEAETLAKQAWQLNAGHAEQVGAEAALYLGLIARLQQRDDQAALGRLKTLLQTGFMHVSWSFDTLLATAQSRLAEPDYRMYAALASAILDTDQVGDLDQYPRWREVAPIALNVYWEDQQPVDSD